MFVSALGAIPINANDALIESQNIFKAVFGNDANIDPQGINGLLIQEIANLIIDNDSALELLYSGLYNPNYAQGVFLDSICAFSQIERVEATASVVTCTCTGLVGTTIPAGSQVLNTNGDIFSNKTLAVIGGGGTVDVVFTSLVLAPIPCDTNNVNRIVQQVAGWDTVNNSSPGVVGTNEQTDYSLRSMRVAGLAKNATSTYNALASALALDSNVKAYWFLVNNTSSPVSKTTGITPNDTTISVGANTVYISVYGESDDGVAKLIYDNLSGGCSTQGARIVTFTDPDFPFISNTYHYTLPTTHRLEIDVTLPGTSGDYPANATALIQEAVYNSYYGIGSTNPVKMWEPINTSRFYPAVEQLGFFNITSIQIGLFDGTLYDLFQLNITELGTLAKDDVVVIFA